MPVIVDPGAVNPPPPVSMTSPDGILTATIDAANGGVLLEAQFPTPYPHHIRFLRGGAPVRSGDTARSPGGFGIAYDDEVPWDVASSWTAVAYDFFGAIISTSQPVALLLTMDTTDFRTGWIKSLSNPGLDCHIRPTFPLPTFTRKAQSSLQAVPGSPYVAGSYSVRQCPSWTLSFWTRTQAEERATDALFADGGVLLFQTLPSLTIRPDIYVIAGDLAEDPTATMRIQGRAWSVELTETFRPPTIDAPLIIPGRSYDDTRALAGTYDQSTALWATYRQIVEP